MTSTESGSSHTNWAMIFQAARGDDLPATEALEILVRRYWPAIFAFVRSTGRTIDEAADLTQGFVCDVILSRNLLSHADPKRGRFRTLLLTALQNYVRDKHRHDTRTIRSSGVKPLQLDEGMLARASEAIPGISPEQAFSAQWQITLVHRVLERVQAQCAKAGLSAHWSVFEARVVRPMLLGESRLPYAKLVERLELTDAGQAANMMITVKRRFVLALLEEIGGTVSDPAQIEDELRALLRDLEQQS